MDWIDEIVKNTYEPVRYLDKCIRAQDKKWVALDELKKINQELFQIYDSDGSIDELIAKWVELIPDLSICKKCGKLYCIYRKNDLCDDCSIDKIESSKKKRKDSVFFDGKELVKSVGKQKEMK